MVVGDLAEPAVMRGLFQGGVPYAWCADPAFTGLPETVIHYAEQPSAPYSLINHHYANVTLQNNLLVTNNLVWALRDFCREAHVIHIGTMGEYGTPDIDIEEGWLEIEHKGRKDRFLFPRQASKLYHTTKIMDTDLMWFAVRMWDLRITDLMQARSTAWRPGDLARVCAFRETAPAEGRPLQPGETFPVELAPGDIRNPEDCESAARGRDVIVHLAANTGVAPSVEDPRGDMEANVAGTLNMLEAARRHGVKRFVFASSGAPVGEVEPPIHEEPAPRPVSPYRASKLAGEGYCSAYHRTFGLETIALRFGNVYGPGSSHKSSLVAKFIRQALEGTPCEIYGDGGQTRDFVFIQDLVDALIKAALFTAPPPPFPPAVPWGLPFQIATSREHTVNEVAELLREAPGGPRGPHDPHPRRAPPGRRPPQLLGHHPRKKRGRFCIIR